MGIGTFAKGLLAVGAVALLSLATTGCANTQFVSISGQTSSQLDSIGNVQLNTTICTTTVSGTGLCGPVVATKPFDRPQDWLQGRDVLGRQFRRQVGYGYNDTVNNNIGDDETPASVGTIDLGGHTALQITGGDNDTCALFDDHTVHCWGTGFRGINGYPGQNDYYSPPTDAVDFGSGRTALQVEGGSDHTCAALEDHTVRCWGFGDDGRLGYGNTQDVGDDETPGSAGAINLGAGRTAVAVSAGRYHSCALMDTGDVRCWGEGSTLGYGSHTSIGDDETPDTAGPVSLGD